MPSPRQPIRDYAIGCGPLYSHLATATREPLDVCSTEPLPAESPFWDLPNVLISPHSASTVVGENAKIVEIFCWNLRCWLDGRRGEMRNVLDKTRMY